jgi:hypothetical protein
MDYNRWASINPDHPGLSFELPVAGMSEILQTLIAPSKRSK